MKSSAGNRFMLITTDKNKHTSEILKVIKHAATETKREQLLYTSISGMS